MLSVASPLWRAKLAFYDAIKASPTKLDDIGIKQAEDAYRAALIRASIGERVDMNMRDADRRELERQNHLKAVEMERVRAVEEARQNGLGRKR